MNVSYSELSRWTGISYRTIKAKLDAAGLNPVEAGKQGKAHLWDSEKALPAIFQPAGGTDDGTLDLNAERARESKERADKLELENAVRRKELLPAESVKRVWAGLITTARNRLESLPSKLAAMATEKDDTRRFFNEARDTVHEVLNQLGRGAA